MRRARVAVQVFSDRDRLADGAAVLFTRLAAALPRRKAKVFVALSGGKTPERFYGLLADPRRPYRSNIPWGKIHFFWGDEREAPPSHSLSNYRMAYRAMLGKLPKNKRNAHRIDMRLGAEAAAGMYEAEMRRYVSAKNSGVGSIPKFDLIILGVGADGHIASLFPGSPALKERRRLVAAASRSPRDARRVTMTFPVLNRASNVILLVAGREKASVVARLFRGEAKTSLPVQRLNPQGRTFLLMDDEAASKARPYLTNVKRSIR